MAAMPPIGESNYPREALLPAYGAAEKLQALGDAYYGLNTLFLINVLLGVGVILTGGANSFGLFLVALAATVIIVGVVSLKYTKKLAFGMNWPPAAGWVCSILFGLGIGGIITYIVLQMIAAQEIKRYGVKSGAFGMKKKEYRAALAVRRELEAAHPAQGAAAPRFETS